MGQEHGTTPDRRPTYKERFRAANEALKAEEQRRRVGRLDKLGSRERWRDKVAEKFLRPEHFLECWQLLGMVEGFELPEEIEDQNNGDSVLHINIHGERIWMARERYRDMVYDFTGQDGDVDRKVREPRPWLRIKHRDEFEKLLDLEREGETDIQDKAEKITKAKFSYILIKCPGKFNTNVHIRLELLKVFRKLVNDRWAAKFSKPL